MKQTVKEISRLCGVSVRTLHYYDEIGLLHPAETTEAGYRLYGPEEIARLQQILFFRELDFSLQEIQSILDCPSFDANQALARHRSLLYMKKERLEGLIGLIDGILKGEKDMSLKEFASNAIEAAQKEYALEAKERWGNTEAYQESQRKTTEYGKEDWNLVQKEMESLFQAFAANMDQSPGSPAVQQTVAAYQSYLSRNFYVCGNEMLMGLGEMYLADSRFQQNIDRYGDGLTRFITEAIRAYCAR